MATRVIVHVLGSIAVLSTWVSANVVTPASLPTASLQQPLDRSERQLEQPSSPAPSPAPAVVPEMTGRQGVPVQGQDAGNWRLVGRLLLECSRTGDLVGCLKLKAITTLGRALTSDAAIPILEDVSLARDPDAVVELPADEPQTETELEAALPRSLEERSSRLDRLLLDRLDSFLRSRTVQFTMPLGLGVFEGRGKGGIGGGKKGYGGYMLLIMAGMKAMMMQSAMGGVAMMSGKALIIAKIALLLALLCCLKKGGGEEPKAQIVYAPAPAPEHSSGGGGGGWQSGGGGDWNRRSVTDPNYAHSYAYSAHQRY